MLATILRALRTEVGRLEAELAERDASLRRLESEVETARAQISKQQSGARKAAAAARAARARAAEAEAKVEAVSELHAEELAELKRSAERRIAAAQRADQGVQLP